MTSEQVCVCGHQRSVHTWHAEETDTPGCGLSSCSCGVFRTVQEEALTSQQESVHKHVWDGAYCACGAVRDHREAPASNQQLKPCPFCGSLRIELKDNNYIWYVECADCRVACSVAQRLWPADMSIPVGAWNRRAHETTDAHEADLANQLHEVDRAFRGCLKELDTLRARVPASDYVLVIDMGETHHKEYGQVLFATHDAIHAVEPRETTVSLATYESVVKGRSDFRQAYRQARSLLRQFIAAWEGQPNHENMDRLCEVARGVSSSPEEPPGVLPPAFQSLLDLQPNWDSYGAKRINLACVQKAYEIWRQLAGIWLPVPHSDGTVGLEQHQGGFDIEIDVDLSLPPEKSSESSPVLDHRFIPEGMDPGICQKCGATRASHRDTREGIVFAEEAAESSPDQLVGALQDRVHQDLGRVRAGRAAKAVAPRCKYKDCTFFAGTGGEYCDEHL